MKKRTGNLFGGFVGDASYATVIPTSSAIDKQYRATMGTTVGRQAAKTWPEIPRVLGKLIDTCGHHCFVLPVTQQPGAWLVTFPTKVGSQSHLDLIKRSAVELVGLADVYRWEKVYLPRVGCGSTGLDWLKDVRPVLKDVLDNRFTVIYDEKFTKPKPDLSNAKPVTSRM